MRRKSHVTSAASFIAIILLVWFAFSSQTPSSGLNNQVAATEWSTARAMAHIEQMAQKPHYVGSEAHEEVATYLSQELKRLGLSQQTQTGFTLDSYGNMARPTNIMARLKGTGTGDALVIMSHYDSDPHSSLGASDAASGVATVLEGIRAFMATGKKPLNDIIVLFTDAEELGLNGAQLFVNGHGWAQDVKMVLNFEARGSGGPSYMLVETNGGNREIIESFAAAGVEYPVANSLAYSIYKMIPNDTDLTVFREDGDINGLNFAFIGDHFDYHTAMDTPERLDLNSLAHQGSYLMPLLQHYAQVDLSQGLKQQVGDDHVYFSLPFIGMLHFPFSWLAGLIAGAGVLFVVLMVYGMRKKVIKFKDVLIGFAPFLGSLIIGFLIINYGWAAISGAAFYANKGSVFPYNGYWLIATAAFIGLSISFILYSYFGSMRAAASHSVAPLFFLWFICLLIAFPVGEGGLIPGVFLPGAGYFVVPLICGLVMLFYVIYKPRPSYVFLVILAIPAIVVFAPFIKAFPVALGMEILFVATILTVLLFGMLYPIIGHYKKLKPLAVLSLIVAVVCGITAFAKAEFSPSQPQSTSLVYINDLDTNTATWATYDRTLTDRTKAIMGSDFLSAKELESNTISSKYGNRFRHTAVAPYVPLDDLNLSIKSDSITSGLRTVEFELSSNSPIHRYEIFIDSTYRFKKGKINAIDLEQNNNTGEVLHKRYGNRVLSYYVQDNLPLSISLTFEESVNPELLVYAASFDLLENKQLEIPARPADEISKPFVLNDAIIRKKTIVLNGQ
ncbi:MAG: M20/M25/M40 family metallo-hydrolase [Nonlabens sp.]